MREIVLIIRIDEIGIRFHIISLFTAKRIGNYFYVYIIFFPPFRKF